MKNKHTNIIIHPYFQIQTFIDRLTIALGQVLNNSIHEIKIFSDFILFKELKNEMSFYFCQYELLAYCNYSLVYPYSVSKSMLQKKMSIVLLSFTLFLKTLFCHVHSNLSSFWPTQDSDFFVSISSFCIFPFSSRLIK